MTDLSSWTAYFSRDFGQFFNGFPLHLALAIGSSLSQLRFLGIFFGAMSTSKRPHIDAFWLAFLSEFYQTSPLLVQFVIVLYLPLIQ